VAGHRPDLLGEAYADGDGTAFLSTFGIPIMVYAAQSTRVSRVPSCILRHTVSS
jgi:hypothetical protein